MSKPAWRTNLKTLLNRDPTEGEETAELSEAIYFSESDRGCGLIAGALAENALGEMIRLKLAPLNNDKLDRLFGFEAPLGSFSAKVKIAEAFGIIDADMCADLDCIREIRNTFAHARTAVKFDSPEILAACKQLIGPKIDPLSQESFDSRLAYIGTVFMIIHVANIAMRRHVHAPSKRRANPFSYGDSVALRNKFLQSIPK